MFLKNLGWVAVAAVCVGAVPGYAAQAGIETRTWTAEQGALADSLVPGLAAEAAKGDEALGKGMAAAVDRNRPKACKEAKKARDIYFSVYRKLEAFETKPETPEAQVKDARRLRSAMETINITTYMIGANCGG